MGGAYRFVNWHVKKTILSLCLDRSSLQKCHFRGVRVDDKDAKGSLSLLQKGKALLQIDFTSIVREAKGASITIVDDVDVMGCEFTIKM